MIDYSETLLRLKSAVEQYHDLMLKRKKAEAAQVMKDARILADWLADFARETK